MSLTGKEVLQALKSYAMYKNQTDYTIKKSIGKTKFATVDELNKELTQLKSKKSKDIFVDDMVDEILLRSDIETLSHLCSTNKKNKLTCQSESFWQKKFKYDGLPPIQYDFSFLKDQYQVNSDIQVWFHIYRDLKESQKEAQDILLVNAIEKSRLNNKTNGVFIVQMYGAEYDGHYIPKQLQDDIRKQLNLPLLQIGAQDLTFTLINNQYQLTYLHVEGDILAGKKFTSHMTLTMQETIDLLTLMLFDQNQNDVNIIDERGHDFRYLDVELRANANIHLQIRFALYETLQYLHI